MTAIRRSMGGVLAAALTVGSLGLTRTAHAQLSAQAAINVSAVVAGVAPITVTATNDLTFGTVQAGSIGTITNNATNAGRFDVTGQPSLPVLVSFTLPTVLSGPGGGTIPIAFGTADGLFWAPFPTTATPFDPNAVQLLPSLTGGQLTVGIKGAVQPPALTVSGNYTGAITLTVAYQ